MKIYYYLIALIVLENCFTSYAGLSDIKKQQLSNSQKIEKTEHRIDLLRI